jgi:hypothetical protein
MEIIVKCFSTTDSDRNRTCRWLMRCRTDIAAKLYAYVLMDNQFIYWWKLELAPLSNIMQNLQFRYTR